MTDPRPDAEPEVDLSAYETEEGLDLQRLHAENRRSPYRFRWADRWWELPHPQDLPESMFDSLSQLDSLADAADDKKIGPEEIDAVRGLLVLAFGKRQWADLNDAEPLPLTATFTLFNAWMRWSGESPGEASNSAGSSKSTAERSKRTSRGSTASASVRRSTGRRAAAARSGKSSA